MKNTERFFYIKPENNEIQLKELSDKYNLELDLLIKVYNTLNVFKNIKNLKIVLPLKNDPSYKNQFLVGVQYNYNNHPHVYHTLNDFLLMK